MTENVVITASIVLYKEDTNELSKTVSSFLNTPVSKKLFLIDNSPTNRLKKHFSHPDIEYIFNNKNVGFAAGHNVVLKKITNKSKYHLILNPDIIFGTEVILKLINYMKDKEELALIAPRVVFPDGKFQYTCRRYSTPLEMLSRRLRLCKNYTDKMEYRDRDLTKPFSPDFIHGCFMLFSTNDFIAMKGFDERYHLYMEDADICKKIDKLGKKKIYYPYTKITHTLKKGSSKSLRLFFTHLNSSIKYFKKWGF